MANITIENAPKAQKIDYSDCIVIEKNRLSEWIQKLKNSFYNKEKETYWPFENEEAIIFLNLLDYEDRIS